MNLAPGAILGSLRRRCPGLTVQATAGVLVAVVVLLLVGLDLWHTWTARALNLEVARIQAQNLADALAQQVARSIDLIDVPLREVQDMAATDGLDPAHASDLTELLRRRARITPQLRDMVVLDRTGQWLASSIDRPRDATAPQREFFLVHRDDRDRDVAISAPYLSRATGRLSIAVSRRLDDAHGEFLGVVLASMDLSFFENLYDSYSVGKQGAIVLLRSDGTVLARRPVLAAALGRNLAGSPLFQDHVARADSGSFIGLSSIDGVRRLETYRRLGALPLVVLIATGEEDALAAWRRDAFGHLVGIGLLATVATLLAWRIAVLWRQQRAAEVKASRAMADYRLLADNAGDMIVVNDLVTLERRYMSPASRVIYGRSPEELVGTNPMDFVHPDDLAGVHAIWVALQAGDDSSMSCHRIRLPDDRWIWVETKSRIVRDAEGRPTGEVVSVVRDVSQRVRAESELRESEGRYRLLAENATDMIIRLTLDGKRVYTSPAYREILGYETAELEAGTAGDIVVEADRSLFSAPLADLAAGRRDVAVMEYRVRHRDGHPVWVETRLKLVRDAATGAPVEIVGVVRDNSRQKEIEEKLRAAHGDAERSNRMRSAFFSNMSHELRTPLNAVIGFADLMRHETLGPLGLPKYREYVEDIHASGEHLLSIINDILDFAKLEAGALVLHREPVQLGTLAATSCRLMAAKAEQKGVALSFAVADDGLDALGDPVRIKQVLLNLLSNAIKFTPAGGKVTVTAGMTSDGSPAVSVADTGIGIAPEDLVKVIEPFGQVDNARNREGDGTGLGLPLSRGLMEMQGGTLELTSHLGIGTTVTARFQRAEADVEALAGQ